MNEIERQILLNQKDIMIWISQGKPYDGFFGSRLKETEELLNPEESEDESNKERDELLKEKVRNSEVEG